MNCAEEQGERSWKQRSLLCFGKAWLGEFRVFSAATEGTFFVGGDLAMKAPKKRAGNPPLVVKADLAW